MRYTDLAAQKELQKRAAVATASLSSCRICPHACEANRLAGHTGFCRAGRLARVSDFGPHFGEEPPLVGRGGSGTIFFAYCNMRCVFCQNYHLSHFGHGKEMDAGELAGVMLSLQAQGCENINLVTPTHYVPQILEALGAAAEKGLCLPLVYNCGSYESTDTLRLLDGIVDIYLPDTKYSDPGKACCYSGVRDYPARMFDSLKEMYRQVGDLVLDRRGVAVRGLLIRHLVMPGGLPDTAEVLRFIARELSPDTYVNIMGQYRPAFRAREYTEINRKPTRREMAEAFNIAREFGLRRVFG